MKRGVAGMPHWSKGRHRHTDKCYIPRMNLPALSLRRSFGFLRATLPPHINMTARPKTYLVTGANRGLGFGYVTALLARDNVVVYAGARDPSRSTHLQDLQKTHANLHILKISSADKEDNLAAAREVEKVSGYLDVLVANAGESGVLNTGNCCRLITRNARHRRALVQGGRL
jgi:hypothetical protein